MKARINKEIEKIINTNPKLAALADDLIRQIHLLGLRECLNWNSATGEKPSVWDQNGTLMVSEGMEGLGTCVIPLGPTKEIIEDHRKDAIRYFNKVSIDLTWSDLAIKKVGFDKTPYVLIDSGTLAIVAMAKTLENLFEAVVLWGITMGQEFSIMKFEGNQLTDISKELLNGQFKKFVEARFPEDKICAKDIYTSEYKTVIDWRAPIFIELLKK